MFFRRRSLEKIHDRRSDIENLLRVHGRRQITLRFGTHPRTWLATNVLGDPGDDLKVFLISMLTFNRRGFQVIGHQMLQQDVEASLQCDTM